MQVEKASIEDVEKIEKIVEKNYGCRINLKKYDVYFNKKQEIFLASKSLNENLSKSASYFGLCFGKLKRGEKIQLTTEGAQIIGKNSTKNIAILDDENIFRFMEGLDSKAFNLVNCEDRNFVIIKNDEDFFGSGLLRENSIESNVSKGRRIIKSMKKI
jgi:NOL1/NOP2/fmu family ribosome biogenesis protein